VAPRVQAATKTVAGQVANTEAAAAELGGAGAGTGVVRSRWDRWAEHERERIRAEAWLKARRGVTVLYY
jgi:hypothetical protein